MKKHMAKSQEESIFDGAVPQVGEFFAFKKVGDNIQGTYIDRRDGIDGFGNEQFIYVLQDKSTKIWNIGVKKTSLNLIRQMEMVPFGFIVGFRFDEERENKRKPGMHPTKIINAYYNLRDPKNPKFVDLAWMESQKMLGRNTFTADNSKNPPVEVDAAADDFDTFLEDTKDEAPGAEDGFGSIRKLAVTKGMVDAKATVAEANAIIEAVTELPLTKENMSAIVVAITKFKK